MWEKITLLKKLSESGGMGDIYLAYHKDYGATYAVKKMKNDLARTKDIKRFIREISIIQNLSHPNIAKIIDYSKDENNLGYAMEYCPEGSLSKHLTANKKTQTELMDMFWKVADALNLCHTNSFRIIHRDIKPSNILIGVDGEPKLSDFGLAINLDTLSERITSSNWISYGYSPPEQYKNFKDCDARSDIYSLGATLYTMLTNEVYENQDNLKTIGDYRISHLLKGMLKHEKNERFESIEQIKRVWDVLSNDISITDFLKLSKETKIGKLKTFYGYYCGMESDILRLNEAAYLLQAVIDIEVDDDIKVIAKEVFAHIDTEGKALDAEMEQDNPKW